MELADMIPDLQRLTGIFADAAAPTFFLGAVAAFVSLMSARLSEVIGRIRELNEIAADDPGRARLREDLSRLRRRARYLHSGITAALWAGIFATLLLTILFVSSFRNFKYAYGAGFTFVVAALLLGFALFRFAQEARLGLSEMDEYR